MGIWAWLFGVRSNPMPEKEWLAISFKLSDGQFGSRDERERVHRFSDQLAALVEKQGVGEVDGDEFGNGEGTLFLTGSDANKVFDVVRSALSDWEALKGGYVIKRYGDKARQERIDF